MKAKNKKTGEIVEFSVDNRLITHYVGSYAYTEDQFNELYEIVEDEPLFKPYKIKFRRDDKFKLKPEAEEMDGKVLDFRFGWDIEDGIYKGEKAMIPKTSYLAWVATGDLEEIEDPNHPYGGMEVLDNVPKETWRTRLYDLYVDNFFEPHDGQIEDFFQQELERIKNNFMTEFTDPDTGMLDIGKYDHEEIINFFNREII